MDPDNIDDQRVPKTAGIPPAKTGALAVLQFATNATPEAPWPDATGEAIEKAADDVATYHAPTEDQARRHANLSTAVASFLFAVVHNCPPGPERSTAISHIRTAKMWASAAVALEGV